LINRDKCCWDVFRRDRRPEKYNCNTCAIYCEGVLLFLLVSIIIEMNQLQL
jgi:hypothetical protein